jgi:vacuolar-type H+-ATPase subunit E/Vma4
MKEEIKRVLDIEQQARKIVSDAENKVDKIKSDAEKEAKRIVADAKEEAKSIMSGYQSRLLETQKKEKKEVEKKSEDLRNDWLDKYENVKEELFEKLITSSLNKK